MCVCASMCVCKFLHDDSKSNQSSNIKFEHVEYENIPDKFDIGHCRTKVKVTVQLRNFSPFTAIQTIRSPITTFIKHV